MSTQATATDKFEFLPLGVVVASLTNPRKSFRVDKLNELAESIKASGVHQPILVRPLPGERVGDTDRCIAYEIVAGERRFRASIQAGVATIPALIRTLNDDQVIEIQLVENLQRDDLTELEEAEGYEQLMQRTGISAEAVGGKIGKSRSYVYARLKLLDLSMACKEALRTGAIDASRALLIARIPDSKLQAKALTEATRQCFGGEVCSVRALQRWLQDNVMLRLDIATFTITDATLVAAAGSCKACPKRTGANPDLFSDVQGADICTDPACYNSKGEAHRADVLATAEKKGMRLIEGTEAKEICHQYSNLLEGYSALKQVRGDLTQSGDEVQLGVLLGKDAPAAVLIENPWTKELIAAVPTEEAEGVLLAKGLIKATVGGNNSATGKNKKRDIAGEIETLKAQAAKATDKLVRETTWSELLSAIRATPDKQVAQLITPTLLRAWLTHMTDEIGEDDMAVALGIELDPAHISISDKETELRLHIQACESAKLYRALAIIMITEDHEPYIYKEIPPHTLFEAAAAGLGVDLIAINADAAASVKNDTVEKIRMLKAELKEQAKPAKPLLPLASAAQAKGGGGDKGSKNTSPAALARELPVRKRKMSADEAQAAIAAAMQGQDTNPGADAQGNVANSSQPVATAVADAPSEALAVGMRVCVTSDTNVLQLSQCKWAGKEGTVTQNLGDRAWMLTFKGRTGGMASFDGSELVLTPRLIKDNAIAKTPKTPKTEAGADNIVTAEYAAAVAIVKAANKVSISLVQRSLKVGYNHAAWLIEEMEKDGIVGPMKSDGGREILKTSESAL